MIDWNEVMRRSANANPNPPRRVEKTEDEWKSILAGDVFQVTRQAGTERAFSIASRRATRFVSSARTWPLA